MRGGARPGAGRPKKTAETTHAEVKREARKAKLTPLAYMLSVLNDEDATKERRDRMAMAAAPFVHPRAADVEPGKKAERAARAQETGVGRFATPPQPKLVVDNGR